MPNRRRSDPRCLDTRPPDGIELEGEERGGGGIASYSTRMSPPEQIRSGRLDRGYEVQTGAIQLRVL